jgi:hypothetical protein
LSACAAASVVVAAPGGTDRVFEEAPRRWLI